MGPIAQTGALMSVGLGLFLSSCLLAIVILYGITKDRWNWRRIPKRSAFVFVAVALFGAACVGAVYVWDWLPTPVTRQTEYVGLRLGMPPDEVMYVKGYPPVVLAEEVNDPAWKGFFSVIETKSLENGKSVKDYRNWSYNAVESNLNVAFNDSMTAVTAIQCYSSDMLARCPELVGVRDGAIERDVLRRLGKPSQSKIEGVTKSMTYDDLGIKLWLEKEQVYMLEISVPEYIHR
jgi:hypothetical protein